MQGNVITGAGYFFRGLSMLTQPGLKRFVIVPFVTNVVLFAAIGLVAYETVMSMLDATISELPSWLLFLRWIIIPFVWLLGALTTGYLSTFLVLIITSPFLSLLAEKVEEQVTGEPVPALESLSAALYEIPRSIARELRKVMYYIPMALGVFVLSWIPAVNVLAPLLWFILGAWMMSLQFVDYPMDNHRFPFTQVRDACASRRLSSLSFGGVVAFVSGIPLANMIVIPAAVIGATLLWCEELRVRR
jgi:CysZ protein